MCSGVSGHTGDHHTPPVVCLQNNDDDGVVMHVARCTRSHRRPPHTSCCLTSFLWKSTCHVEVQCHEPNLTRDRTQVQAPKIDPLKSRWNTKPSDLDYPRAKFFQTRFFFGVPPRLIGPNLRAKASHVSITRG